MNWGEENKIILFIKLNNVRKKKKKIKNNGVYELVTIQKNIFVWLLYMVIIY